MSVLDEILARVRARIDEGRRERSAVELRSRAEASVPGPSFVDALRAPGTSVIAEAKHRSPSKGILRSVYDPAALARTYEAAGARGMSVLTEPDFFGGAPEHLRAARAACALPLLRKDFVIDDDQVFEARAWGASAVLLIVAALDDARLCGLAALAGELGLAALVEVHTEAEAERALAAGAEVIGVNNRDLATFRTDRRVTARVARIIPPGVLVVSESGIQNRAHVLEVEAAGAEAVLVGEAIVSEDDPATVIRELLGKEPA